VYQFHSRLLYESICEQDNVANLQFYFFCFDHSSLEYYRKLNLKNVHLVSLDELEIHLPGLKQVKSDRSLVEYFFTSTPAVCKYVLEKYEPVDELVYLDADLFFFQSPEIIFKEINGASISIVPHRFNFINYIRNIYGYYNVGWVSFKKDREGIACLNKWYEDNLEWCFDKLTFKKYADQKYLDYWEKDFKNICIIKNRGVNVGPWNVGNYKISLKNNSIYVDNDPLIFYHFASMKFLDGGYYTTISSYFSYVSKEVKELIYAPYIKSLYDHGFTPRSSARLSKGALTIWFRKIIRKLYKDTIIIKE